MKRLFHDCTAAKQPSGDVDGKRQADRPSDKIDKIEDSDDNMTGCGGCTLPPYVELSSQFISLQTAVGVCANAFFCLQCTRMSFIKAHASKPVPQADMKELCESQQGQRVEHNRGLYTVSNAIVQCK